MNATRKDVRRSRLEDRFLYALTAGLVVWTLVLTAQQRDAQRDAASSARTVIAQTCERMNETRRALRTIILRGDRNLAAFLREGTINRAQYERALLASRRARADLGDEDCAALARRIPVKS